ncbi:methanogenesis marker protein 8 [Methanohalobium evestigatum Z-7303]|uniref:Methanogenesis marker protein 8 n=1 Tax=Methanohalobium evestigatum (strain ATCC BAA-1072 / DSM 3721 / NBRC 107634 / OCM 161 / Z-7303) TaxID=644295 RepID=D7E9Y3_METEZ|nr:methanogenesis marker 8 protein [Methanohalobium evestigatum]ADI74405.1 methanogenesis marker protein 8 [Methanohalobium evestigatum Z-7303]
MPHKMEMLGKTKVTVKDGKVVDVSEPVISWCPIFDKVHGIKKITPEDVKKNMEFRINDFGMFTDKREIEQEVFVGFGASEIMMTGLRRNVLDSTVTVCDGAGTVITSNPKLVQGMGARISGLVETEPIEGLIERIQKSDGVVLDPYTAKIDPIEGVRKAHELGYKRIAVTVPGVDEAKKLRDLESELGLELILIGVHITGIERDKALQLIEYLDITTACASKNIRDVIKPLVQVGTAVPLFGITQRGKEIMLERAKEVEKPILVNTTELPELPEEKQPK